MACDICGKTGTHLNDLLSIYQTDEIKQICPDCAQVANKAVRRIQGTTNNILRDLVKRFLRQRKDDFSLTREANNG